MRSLLSCHSRLTSRAIRGDGCARRRGDRRRSTTATRPMRPRGASSPRLSGFGRAGTTLDMCDEHAGGSARRRERRRRARSEAASLRARMRPGRVVASRLRGSGLVIALAPVLGHDRRRGCLAIRRGRLRARASLAAGSVRPRVALREGPARAMRAARPRAGLPEPSPESATAVPSLAARVLLERVVRRIPRQLESGAAARVERHVGRVASGVVHGRARVNLRCGLVRCHRSLLLLVGLCREHRRRRRRRQREHAGGEQRLRPTADDRVGRQRSGQSLAAAERALRMEGQAPVIALDAAGARSVKPSLLFSCGRLSRFMLGLSSVGRPRSGYALPPAERVGGERDAADLVGDVEHVELPRVAGRRIDVRGQLAAGSERDGRRARP